MYRNIIFLLAIYFISCANNQPLSSVITDDKKESLINEEKIIFDYNGKIMSIPIYRGIEQDLIYGANSHLGFLVFKAPSNIITTKYFNDFIKFYAKNLMGNINIMPTNIRKERHYYLIWYDFRYQNINSSMNIIVRARDDIIQTSPIKIQLDDGAKLLMVDLRIGTNSPFFKGD
jgi:hypothetical protein